MMSCFVCGAEISGEVCDQCAYKERGIYHKEWDYKENLLKKPVSYRVDVTSYRIKGTAAISDRDNGLNGRMDAFNHFVGNIDYIKRGSYNGKESLMMRHVLPGGRERYIFLQGFDEENQLKKALEKAKSALDPTYEAESDTKESEGIVPEKDHNTAQLADASGDTAYAQSDEVTLPGYNASTLEQTVVPEEPMKINRCCVCQNETTGEVCDQCMRMERSLFHREWDYKEGFLVKKVEPNRVDVTSYRISGLAMLCSNSRGQNGVMGNFNHFLGYVESLERRPYNGKDALMIRYKNPDTKVERFIFLVNFDAEAGLRNAVENAKRELQTDIGIASAMTLANMSRVAGEREEAKPAADERMTPVADETPASVERSETLPAATDTKEEAPPKSSLDVAAQLRKLKILFDTGILTAEEYEQEKALLE